MRPTHPGGLKSKSSVYDSLRRRESLWLAWQAVAENALQSRSAETVSEAKEFARGIRTHLDRIATQLRSHRFEFRPQQGALVRKKGKTSKRPIVIAPIESRIVQRAILDAVQKIPAVERQLKSGYNFGGVPGSDFGVPQAIVRVHAAIQEKAYFIRTDIRAFFVNIPRERAIRCVLDHVDDPNFEQLFIAATTTEIEDAAQYGKDLALFPIHDEGVAQGSCLSPLLCNLLLHEFDRKMNGRGIITVRYIDDFLILAADQTRAYKAFDGARRHLQQLGLDVYDPRIPADAEKADAGKCSDGIPFLGCEIRPDRVRPSRAKCRELVTRLRFASQESLAALLTPVVAIRMHLTYAETLDRMSKVVRGWANTMAFCTDDRLMDAIDVEISKVVETYGREVARLVRDLSPLDRRRALGVFAVADRVPSVARDEILRVTGASHAGA